MSLCISFTDRTTCHTTPLVRALTGFYKFSKLGSHLDNSHSRNPLLAFLSHFLPGPPALATANGLCVSVDLPFGHRIQICWCGLVRLASLTQHDAFQLHPCRSMCPYIPLHAVSSVVWTSHVIDSRTSGRAACFSLLPVMTMLREHCVHVDVSFSFHCLWCSSQSATAGSCGNSVFILFRNCQAVSHSEGAIFHFHQQCTRGPIAPRPRRPLSLPVFLTVVI